MKKNEHMQLIYQSALKKINHFFKEYNDCPNDLMLGKTLHLTSQQMRNFPNLINFYQKGPGSNASYQTVPDQFEEMCKNIKLLKNLKVTCIGQFVVELQQFTKLENLHLVGPYLHEIKGLRSASCTLKSLIVENGEISLNELLSLCCMDESRPMCWPRLLSLKMSNCSVHLLDSSLQLLPNLQELDLSFNKITVIKDELCGLDQVTHINLGFNYLKVIPQFSGGITWSLRFLYLPYNDLTGLEGLQLLENLLELDISHNIIIRHAVLEPLRYLAKLEKLDLQGNPLCYQMKHREYTVTYISSLALKSEFVLDGKNLTDRDLKVAMYTPVAVQYNRYPGHFNASINNIEPDSYDVSMSSAVENSGRRMHGDPYFKMCSSTLKKKKSLSSRQQSRSNADHFSRDEEQMDGNSESSSDPQDQTWASTAYSNTGPKAESTIVSAMVLSHSTHDSSDTSPSPPSSSYSLHAASAAATDTEDVEQKSESNISKRDADSSVNAQTSTDEIQQDAVLSLKAKKNCEDPELSNNVLVCLFDDHLLEAELGSGQILEKFELDTLLNVSLLSARQMSMKFSYYKKEKSSRLYTFADDSLDKISVLFDKLEDVSKRNESMNKKHLICIKCSKSFFTTERNLVCSCGSDMLQLVPNHEQPVRSRSLRVSECEEAVDSSKPDIAESKYSNNPSGMTKSAIATGLSLSWAHSMNDMIGFGPSESLLRTDDVCHISGSMPTNLSEVLGQHGGASKLGNTASASLVESMQHGTTPFKSFPNLLPHDEIYKLVEVTPTQSDKIPEKTEVKLQPGQKDSEPFTPQPSGRNTNPQAGDSLESRHKKVIVTSTPRRRVKNKNLQVSSKQAELPGMNTDSLENLPRRRRELEFGKHFGTDSETQAGDELWFHQANLEKLTNDSAWLLNFVEEELLEIREELVLLQETKILRNSGKLLAEFTAHTSPTKGIFGRSRKRDSNAGYTTEHSVSYVNVLVVVTTSNLHFLEITDEKTTGPEHLESYSLEEIAGVGIGLQYMSVLIAICDSSEEKKLDMEHVKQIYNVFFSDSEKSANFHEKLVNAFYNQKSSHSSESMNGGASAKVGPRQHLSKEMADPFSDFLEKIFSEDVLLHLDLSAPTGLPSPEISDSFQKLVNVEMFSHYPCTMQDVTSDAEMSMLLVISCGGSLVLVHENAKLLMHEFGMCLLRTKKGKRQNQSSPQKSPPSILEISRSSVSDQSGSMYKVKSASYCSQLASIVRFANQSDYLQFNFDKNEENTWGLKFTHADCADGALALIGEFWRLEKKSNIPILWR